MSTNCVKCVVRKRTSFDLLCNECRSVPATTPAEIQEGNLYVRQLDELVADLGPIREYHHQKEMTAFTTGERTWLNLHRGFVKSLDKITARLRRNAEVARSIVSPPATPNSMAEHFGRWPLGINPGMDEHAASLGLGHWSCVSPNSNEWWVRIDGLQLEAVMVIAGYPEELANCDRENPIKGGGQ